jgi:hypothetical protein
VNDGFQKEPVVHFNIVDAIGLYMTKEEKQEYRKKRYQANKEAIKEKYKGKYKERQEYNKEYSRRYNAPYAKKRRAFDPAYKLICNVRSRHWEILKGRLSTTEGLGCDSKFFRNYLSSLWTEGMSWDNYGRGKDKWNIDHILPLTLYYTQPELLPKLIHYSNMQPMWQPENISKKNKIKTKNF